MPFSTCAASRYPAPGRDQTGRGQAGVFDRHVGMLLEQALKPAGANSRVAARIFPSDQHGQLERVEQAQLREFSRRRHRSDHVPAREGRYRSLPVQTRATANLGGDGFTKGYEAGARVITARLLMGEVQTWVSTTCSKSRFAIERLS
jgi:hypothetical protein